VRFLLMGNPNVGKSVIFSQLTGLNVVASNYPGTTVEYSVGRLDFGALSTELVDVPGTYSLEGSCEAERVALTLLPSADLVINVVDSTNLERNLNLTLQLLGRGVPTMILLNLWDEAGRRGIHIDAQELEEYLGVPVIRTVGISGKGLAECLRRVPDAVSGQLRPLTPDERWREIGQIVARVQTLSQDSYSLVDRLQDASLHPVYGTLMALGILSGVFRGVLYMGETIISHVSLPLFSTLVQPLLLALSSFLGGSGTVHDLLVGSLHGGAIDFERSMGLLSTGLYVPLGIVLPYIISFYLVLGLLEDIGYLPRLSILVDRVMHKVGLHGYSIIPMILGAGCNVPGILATRNLGSRRERFIAATLLALAVPCMAQLAMIFVLVGRCGGAYLAVVLAALFAIWLTAGLLADRWCGGYTPSLLIELPPYRLPSLAAQLKKLWMRARAFIMEGVPYVLGGMLLINLLDTFGLIRALGALLQPLFVRCWGLPPETVAALIVGLLRKDAAVVLLEALPLTSAQIVTAAVVLTVFFPCAATFGVLVRELGFRDAGKTLAVMLVTALISGTLLHLLLDRWLAPGILAPCLVGFPLAAAVLVRGRSEKQEMLEE